MAFRGRRKRERRPAADAQADTGAGHQGERAEPNHGGAWGAAAGLWADASRSDLLLLRRAIREGWLVPAERRGPILEEVCSRFEDNNATTRLSLAIARVVLDASNYNLDVIRGATRASDAAGESSP